MRRMNSYDSLNEHADELVKVAQAFHAAAGEPGSHVGAPLSLERTEEALQLLSGAWYQLAADAAPGIAARSRRRSARHPSASAGDGLSHEQEAGLIAMLHDVAAAFASCARTCREERLAVTPVITRRVQHETRDPERPRRTAPLRFGGRSAKTPSVA